MKLNKKRILGYAADHYRGKFNGHKSYGLAEECVDLAQDWIYTYEEEFPAQMAESPREMRTDLKSYIQCRVSYAEHKAMFIPAFIWIAVAQAIISWIVGKIIDNILDQREEGRYLAEEEEEEN